MVPHLSGRAVTLRRFPEGVDDLDAAFFEKRCPKHRPRWVKTANVRAGPNAGKIDFCVCDGLPTLIWMAQLAAIELHPSLSLATGADAADRARLRPRPRPAGRRRRLLPGGAAPARHVRPLRGPVLPQDLGLEGDAGLRAAELASARYDGTKPFAKAIAQLLEKQTPDRVVSKMKKAEREGKVFVDWSQNHRSKTTIAVYSLRARERPTVSTPITWDEVEARRGQRRGGLARLRGRRRARPHRASTATSSPRCSSSSRNCRSCRSPLVRAAGGGPGCGSP